MVTFFILQEELERLNKASNDINKLEFKIDVSMATICSEVECCYYCCELAHWHLGFLLAINHIPKKRNR